MVQHTSTPPASRPRGAFKAGVTTCCRSESRVAYSVHPTCTNPARRSPTYLQASPETTEDQRAPDASAGAIRTSATKEPGARRRDAPGALPRGGSEASAGCTG